MFKHIFWLLILYATVGLTMPTPPAQAQSTACTVTTASDAVIPLFAAPLYSASVQIGYLTPGSVYAPLERHGNDYMIGTVAGDRAYFDRRSTGLSSTGTCDSLPLDTTPITDFEAVCVFRPTTEYAVLPQPALGEISHVTPTTQPVAVIGQHVSDLRYWLVALGDAMSGWVAADVGRISGPACDAIPWVPASPDARTHTQANLWSAPDASLGQIVATVAANTAVHVDGTPLRGLINIEANVTGLWFHVRLADGRSGWAWQGQLQLGGLPMGGDVALALDNTRLWSQPNVRWGQVVADIAPGSPLAIMRGPQLGPIRFDTDALGNWYEVRYGDMIGWVWEGRLDFVQ